MKEALAKEPLEFLGVKSDLYLPRGGPIFDLLYAFHEAKWEPLTARFTSYDEMHQKLAFLREKADQWKLAVTYETMFTVVREESAQKMHRRAWKNGLP